MSLRNIHSMNRQKYKRAANAVVRKFNKENQNDWLWNGRFIMAQECAFFLPYEDHSGGEYIVFLTLTDTKTNRKEMLRVDNYDMEWKMWEWANRCITEIWKVWNENPNPNAQARLEGREPPKFI